MIRTGKRTLQEPGGSVDFIKVWPALYLFLAHDFLSLKIYFYMCKYIRYIRSKFKKKQCQAKGLRQNDQRKNLKDQSKIELLSLVPMTAVDVCSQKLTRSCY